MRGRFHDASQGERHTVLTRKSSGNLVAEVVPSLPSDTPAGIERRRGRELRLVAKR